MANRPFTQGVHDLGAGGYAYIQPDGTWGWSNAGLIVSGGETLLVDTLVSVPLTRLMLDDFAKLPGGGKIDRAVNTHANPDHWFGNQLLAGTEIISTVETRKGIEDFDPALLAGVPANWRQMGEAGEFLFEAMGKRFDFEGIEKTLPNRTFERSLSLTVGDKAVELIDVGPAHTESDTLVYVPADKLVFTGDILFNEGHPIMWAGPIENWIAACDHILRSNAETVVPGHGPVTDKTAVANLRAYFEYVRAEARARYDAGMGWEEAARDINMQEFRGWSDPERIVANVFALYRQFGADLGISDGPHLFAAMLRYQKAQHVHDASCGHAH